MIPILIIIAMVGGSFFIWFTNNADTLLSGIGKDTTLTGRGDMWPYILEMSGKRPLLGYGYGGFWQGFEGESAYIWRAVGWPAPNSHNGLLDLLIDLGISGVSIFLLGFWITLVRALAWLRSIKTSEGFWPFIFIIMFVLVNMTETTLMVRNDIFWVTYVSIAFSLQIPARGSIKMVHQVQPLVS